MVTPSDFQMRPVWWHGTRCTVRLVVMRAAVCGRTEGVADLAAIS